MEQNKYIIPIDSALDDFDKHLQSHPRTILSAQFGDGKTYFLKEFTQKKTDGYEVIRIVPINYQVAENRDIFDLIKWNLLFELSNRDLLTIPENLVTKGEAFKYTMENHGMTLLEGAAEVVSKIPTPGVNTLGKFAKSTLSLFKGFCEAKKDYQKALEGDDKELNRIIDAIEEIPTIECDLLTQLIQDSISAWKKKNEGKRIVLVFDDMDRLDPAHLFRILNVISAHIDYGYKFGIENTEDVFPNKFGFDNIVVVLDYENLVKIFHHFYGADTDINGYIRKFCDKGIFSYSIKEEAMEYFWSVMSHVFDYSVDELFPQHELEKKSLRDIVSCIEGFGTASTPNHFVRVLRLWGMSDNDILEYAERNGEVITDHRGLDLCEFLCSTNKCNFY